jgi:hypothetical protein
MDEFFFGPARLISQSPGDGAVIGKSPACGAAAGWTLAVRAGKQNFRILHQAVGSEESHGARKQKELRVSGQEPTMIVREPQLDFASRNAELRHTSSVQATVKTASALLFFNGLVF